tara:strand:+ start:143 stop:679 length:537 start_codon:yes stop_codon:yes gene_type:complete
MSVIKSGQNGNTANVNDQGQVEVASVTETSLEYASKTNNKAYSYVSTYAATAAQEVIYIKNDSTLDLLIIDEVVIGSSVANVFTLFEVNSGTAAGTVLTAENLNLSSGNSAPSSSFGNASVTGSLSGIPIAIDGVGAGDFETLDMKGSLVLGQNDEIAITAAATGTIYVTVIGHFKAA